MLTKHGPAGARRDIYRVGAEPGTLGVIIMEHV